MSEWYICLLKDINQSKPNEIGAIGRISEFYTQLLDYILNPKIEQKNALCVFKGFIDGNMFENVCMKHKGLFKKIKSDIW